MFRLFISGKPVDIPTVVKEGDWLKFVLLETVFVEGEKVERSWLIYVPPFKVKWAMKVLNPKFSVMIEVQNVGDLGMPDVPKGMMYYSLLAVDVISL